jgi:hypothetical protein
MNTELLKHYIAWFINHNDVTEMYVKIHLDYNLNVFSRAWKLMEASCHVQISRTLPVILMRTWRNVQAPHSVCLSRFQSPVFRASVLAPNPPGSDICTNLNMSHTQFSCQKCPKNLFTFSLILHCLLLIYYYFFKQNFGFCFIYVIIRHPSFSLEAVPPILQAYLIKASDWGPFTFLCFHLSTFKVPSFLLPQQLTFTMSVSLIGSQIKTPFCKLAFPYYNLLCRRHFRNLNSTSSVYTLLRTVTLRISF